MGRSEEGVGWRGYVSGGAAIRQQRVGIGRRREKRYVGGEVQRAASCIARSKGKVVVESREKRMEGQLIETNIERGGSEVAKEQGGYVGRGVAGNESELVGEARRLYVGGEEY